MRIIGCIFKKIARNLIKGETPRRVHAIGLFYCTAAFRICDVFLHVHHNDHSLAPWNGHQQMR